MVAVSFLDLPFMQRALGAAVCVGLAAPAIGVYRVQRRLALLGDGIGHIALTGVALGFVLGAAPVLMAVIVSVAGAIALELLRERGHTSGDVALAILFYGGIAGGVLLIQLAPGGSNANLLSYLFGSLTSVSASDLTIMTLLTGCVLAISVGLSRQLFAVCQDEEFARTTGLPVRWLNVVLAATAAFTVTIAMRVVGLLLVSALMVVPVATAQQLTRGFRATVIGAMIIGTTASVSGVILSYYLDTASGASIVILAIGLFLLAFLARALMRTRAATGPEDTR